MAYTNIDDPSAYFQTALYAGNNTTDHNIANDGNSDLQPDLVWIKQRTSNNPHTLQDTSRGFAGNGEINLLVSNTTGAEVTNGAFESFNTNGFGVGGTNVASGAYNLSGYNYVAWQWKANGGTTVSNTSGSTTTTVQANQDAGFSIVTYLSNGNVSNQTLGHGLGVAPDVIISKRRGATTDWPVYHKSLGVGSIIYLDTNAAASTSSPPYKDTPTSTVFSTQNEFQASDNYVSYCFAEKQGYSKFGKYVGNGSTNGPFVYTGFKPALIITKNADATDSWNLLDIKRSPYNVADKYLQADNANAEGTYTFYDILSNGFKIRNTGNANISGNDIIFMAFAENPFVTSTGIPTTAR